ncbi:uncharacterized protein LOC115879146 [Sitophilus oryzae]|uniref:Uncharacterized protein LOC115879146 n=1 Tax=Sitophilus oryzae TaxID=7048 RepID=A0A6J2XK65_SITOR|nr:uncharacterized protein LOC115879146 [Sitophilus oryzae]
MRAAILKNAVSGFENTGIWPFNPSIFPEEAFVASETTNRPEPTNPPANTEKANTTVNNTNASYPNESIKEHIDINSSSDEDDVPLMALKNLIATKSVTSEKQN